MTVDRLVTSHQMITRGYTDSDTTAIGAGTITIESAAGKLTQTVRLSSLNGGQGVQRGTIRITDRSGASADIDLTKAVDLDDVLDAINTAGNIIATAIVIVVISTDFFATIVVTSMFMTIKAHALFHYYHRLKHNAQKTLDTLKC